MKKALRNLDKPLLIISIILFSIGLIMVFSASNVTAYMSHAVSPYNYFLKQALFLVTGAFLASVMICFSTKTYGRLSKILLIIFTGLLVFVLVSTEAVNEAHSWIDFGFFSIQPSEFIKVISIIWLAHYYDKKATERVAALEKNNKNKKKLKELEKKDKNYIKSLYPLAICAIPAALIFLQPDLGTTIIYVLIVALIFSAAPIDKGIKRKIFFVGIGLIFLVIILMLSGVELINERQMERLDFLRPCDKLLDTGSQVCNGYIAINNGGLTGVGLGNSTQKYLYLPEPYTDFIFAIIIEELGLVTGVFILLMYLILLYRILLIGRNSYTVRGALICYGVAGYIFIHILVNLSGMFGLFILTGVPLPFMSYGGSFTWCLIAALAMVQRVNIENKLEEKGELCQ